MAVPYSVLTDRGLEHLLRGPPLTPFVDRRDTLGARQRRSLVQDLLRVPPDLCLHVGNQGKTPERVPAPVCSGRLGTYEAMWENVAIFGPPECVATWWRSLEDRRDAAVYRGHPAAPVDISSAQLLWFPP
jgi:hypothetical protein